MKNGFLLFMFFLISAFFFSPHLTANEESPIRQLNMSVWSEFKHVDFEGLTQDQKSEKLAEIFQDQLHFIQKHGIRRLIVKILDPAAFSFFLPDKFDSEKPDNFFFWAVRLASYTEIEALFDISPFHLASESTFGRLYEKFKAYFKKEERPFGYFENLIEKLEWVSLINELYSSKTRNIPLVKGIAFDPKGAGAADPIYQNLINALDQFRFSSLESSQIPDWVPRNSFYPLRTAMILPLDQKAIALANLADFPLSAHIREGSPGNLGIRLPSVFPSSEPNFLPPIWRAPHHLRSLLDTVYLQMGDSRLIQPIYQNYDILPDPAIPNLKAAQKLSSDLALNFRGIPFVKGPGYITSYRGTSKVKGSYTYFRTGGVYGEGQFVDGQLIEICSPQNEPIRRAVSGTPYSNRDMQLKSTFGTTFDVERLEYYQTPIPVFWNSPRTSESLRAKIYFVFDLLFAPKGDRFFGNWCFENFMNFIWHEPTQTGFLYEQLFKNLTGDPRRPHNNLVLYDYTLIPNGNPYPDCDWGLENQTHGLIMAD